MKRIQVFRGFLGALSRGRYSKVIPLGSANPLSRFPYRYLASSTTGFEPGSTSKPTEVPPKEGDGEGGSHQTGPTGKPVRGGDPPSEPFVAPRIFQCVISPFQSRSFRRFSSHTTNSSREEEEEEEYEEEEEGGGGEGEGESCAEDSVGSASKCVVERGKTAEEKTEEAAEIGYKVVGPLDPSENPFKPYEPVFAVVQIGSHQFKVSNGDSIYTERLKFCEVNDKLILNRVLMLGSQSQTIIGRPILTDAAVHAVVEEHALDAKVIIFKKKRRKNYRRTKGHRQELTKLRITGIQGVEKPKNVAIAA